MAAKNSKALWGLPYTNTHIFHLCVCSHISDQLYSAVVVKFEGVVWWDCISFFASKSMLMMLLMYFRITTEIYNTCGIILICLFKLCVENQTLKTKTDSETLHRCM